MVKAPANPLELLKWLDDPATWRAISPGLQVGARVAFTVPDITDSEGHPDQPRELPPAGFLRATRHLPVIAVHAAGEAIDAVTRAGLPPVFAYVYDAAWELLEGVAPLGHEYLGVFDVLADVWAFRVEPGSSGWPRHRGFVEPVTRCTTLDVWVALSDADRETSCMWFLPLDCDPAYPGNLSSTTVDADAAVPMEVRAGDVLAWDARVLHWGGPMSRSASAPRMSMTFTLRSRSQRRTELPLLPLAALDLRARLDLIAGELSKYQSLAQPSAEIMAWARLTLETSAVAASRGP